MSDVDDLRQQLRERGYLSHGIERWFALDPWSSRAFWLELATVAAKAAVLIAAFGALPLTAIMLFRNAPVQALETLGLYSTYAAAWLVASFAVVIAIALALKIRPALPIDTPRALLAISVVVGALFVAPIAFWWSRFDTAPSPAELLVGAALCGVYFLVVTVVISAALLTFSIYEVKRIPALHQKSRALPIALAALVLIALLFVPAYADRERALLQPMVVTTPTTARIALIAVDGLTAEILRSRPDLAGPFAHTSVIAAIPGDSTTERWASFGTGVRTEAHGVRALEGVRFRGGTNILQRISRADFVLMELAPRVAVARREPLPPTVRRRDYLWEIFAGRGVPSVAVNWWTTADATQGGLVSIGPETVFTAARGDALRVDAVAVERFEQAMRVTRPRFATVFLPALDVVLNRLTLDPAARLATSLRALDGSVRAVQIARAYGYEVVLTGMPGDGQSGSAVVASTIPFTGHTAWDIAPALLETLGFPSSAEMPGHSAAARMRIPTYGPRHSDSSAHPVNEEYYENLRSLGYIQ